MSAEFQSHDMLKVRIGTAQFEAVLHRHGGNPQIIRRDGGALLAKLQEDARVMPDGCLVRPEHGNAWAGKKLPKSGQVLRLTMACGKTGAQFPPAQ